MSAVTNPIIPNGATPAPVSDEPIWMEHGETGNRAKLPPLPFWQAQGWKPADGPPPEPDLTRDPPPEPTEPSDNDDTDDTENPPDEAGSSSARKTTKAAKSAAKTEEG